MKDSSGTTANAPLDMIQNFASINTLLASIPALETFVDEGSNQLLQASQWNEVVGGPLLERYKSALRKFWNASAPATGVDHLGNACEVLAQLFRESALAEIRWMKATRKVTWEQAESFNGMLNGGAASISRRVTTSINKTVVYLPFDVLVDPATQSAWLLPHDGRLAMFSSESSLLLSLSAGLLQAEKLQALLSMLPPVYRGWVEAQLRTGKGLHLSLSTTVNDLFTARVNVLKTTQDSQLFGLNRELSLIGDTAQRLVRLEHVRSLGGLDVAQSRRMEALLVKIRNEQVPDWLAYGDGSDKSLFTSRGEQQARCAGEVGKQLGPLASYSGFACAHLSSELSKQGLELDPTQVEITLVDTFAVGTQLRNHERQKTLARLELSDFNSPGYAQTKLRLCAKSAAAGLTGQMVRSIVESKNLRVAYPDELKARYFQRPVADALTNLQVARVATSLVAAKMQRALDAQAFALIDGLAGSALSPSRNGVETYFVQLDNGVFQLADVLVLSYRENNKDTFLLYAPNSPSGQDWSKHSNEQRVLDVMTMWAGTLEGRSYLLSQVPFSVRPAMVKSLEVMADTPHLLTRTSISLDRKLLPNWRETLAIMANRQVAVIVEETTVKTPRWYIDASSEERREMVWLDAAIAVSTRHYHEEVKIPTFADYARKTLQEAFDSDPSRKHDERRWDVSKFEILLDKQWRSLVWIAMNGVERGVNVGNLPVSAQVPASLNDCEIVADLMARFLRAHDVPTDYIKLLNKTFLSVGEDVKQRLSHMYRSVAQLELNRALLQMRLDPQAREGINPRSRLLQRDVSIDLGDKFEISGPHDGNNRSSIFHLRIKDARIEGVYLFLDTIDNVESYVLYTPHAPDGIWFRPFEDLARAIEHNELGPYLRLRVAYQHLEQFDRFLNKLKNEGYSLAFIENKGYVPRAAAEKLVKFDKEHQAIINSIINDVNVSTTSKVERFTAMVFARSLQILGVVTLPFPPARMALGVAKVLLSLYRAADAYRTTDRAQAAWHLLDAAFGVAGLTGVSGKPKEMFLEALFKGPPPDLAEKMISKFSDRLFDELDTYLRSITIPEKTSPPTQPWLQPA